MGVLYIFNVYPSIYVIVDNKWNEMLFHLCKHVKFCLSREFSFYIIDC